jgi:hypothetical protein
VDRVGVGEQLLGPKTRSVTTRGYFRREEKKN